MKYLAQLSSLALSVLLLSTIVNAIPTANVEIREPVPEAAPAPVLISDAQLSAPAELEKRRKKPSSSGNHTNTNGATSMTPDGTFCLAGVAFLSTAVLLMA